MNLPTPILQVFDKLVRLCHEFGVQRLYAFGSVLTKHFDIKKSDIDLMVELRPMPPLVRGETLLALWDALEAIFARKVDLLTDQPIQNPYLRNRINRTKLLIYERDS